jgi:Lysozyme inhibitor LprI
LAFRALAQGERFDRGWTLLSQTYKRTVSIPENKVSLSTTDATEPAILMALITPKASPSNRGSQQVLISFAAIMLGFSGLIAWPVELRTSREATARRRDSCVEKIEAKQKAQLKAAVAWIKFRDAHCVFATAPYEGGSMAPTISYGCLAAMTKSRTEELKRVLENLLTQ